jgi:alpha-galactosidase
VAVIPGFILRRLYVPGSLRSTENGFEFSIRNSIAPATVTRVNRFEVDGGERDLDPLSISLPDGTIVQARSITERSPLRLPEGLTITMVLRGVSLDQGEHRFKVCLRTAEVGNLEIGFSDSPGFEPKRRVHVGSQSELPVPLARPVRIAILGAGSSEFARRLMTDLLCTPGLGSGSFALVDIDAERLELAHAIGERLVDLSGRAWTVEASIDRAALLKDCDYMVNTIEVAGLRNVRPDYDIPLKYGVDQCIGDTVGPGGIFKMLRTGPAWLQIVQDVERLCPGALVLNYTNPMSALTLLAQRATRLTVVGLCHSVQSTSRQLANYLDVPYEALQWQCAGINHMAWFTELTLDGEDMYPRLQETAQDPEIYEADPIRFEVLRSFGAFVTESSGHFSEYVPYFRKRPDLIERFTREGYRGESGFYANSWPRRRREADATIRAQLEGEVPILLERSTEYASVIVEAMETDSPARIHGNVVNEGLIDNLPTGGCVEVAVEVDRDGLHPVRYGALPHQLAALNVAHMHMHELMVEAVIGCDRNAALQALMLDPLTAAVCAPDEIRQMYEEMWEAQRCDLLPFE